MSATCYKRPHVDIFICIEMGRERNQGIIKKTPGITITLLSIKEIYREIYENVANLFLYS